MSCEIQPARFNHQPTNQQCIKWAGKACVWESSLGAKMAVFGPNILIILWGSKSCGTHINHCRTMFASFLVGHGTKWTKNANIWPKMTKKAYFGPKILILTGGSTSFGTHVTEKPRHLVCIVIRSGMGTNGPKMLIFGQKMPVLGQKYKFLWE